MSSVTPVQVLADIRTVRMMSFCGYTLLVWDYFLTLNDEMTYIWRSPRSLVKILFLGNRYGNLLIQPINLSQVAGILVLNSNTACLAYTWFKALSQFFSFGSVHILVLLRVWILYGRSRKITITLLVAFILYFCSCIGLLVYALGANGFRVYASSTGTCTGQLAPFTWLLWIASFLLDSCLFGLTVFTLKQQKQTSEISQISHLIRGLYRNAIIFLLANTLSDTMNTITWILFAHRPLNYVTNLFCLVLVNITGQRLAIDLRRMHVHKKEFSPSELSREVKKQLDALPDIEPVEMRPLSV